MSYELKKDNGAWLVMVGGLAVGEIEWNTQNEVVAVFEDSNIGYYPATDAGIAKAAAAIADYFETFNSND